MSQRIDDALAVVRTAERRAGGGRPGSVVRLRQEAIVDVAAQRRVRWQTIHDACVRRLAPEVSSVGDFDRLLDGHLRGDSSPLRRVLERHRLDDGDDVSIGSFFGRRRPE